MATDLNQLVADNYPRIATDLLTPLLKLMQLSREHCGGDADKFLVMLVVALRTTRHHEFAAYTPKQLASGEASVLPGLGTNGRSIAASLGIPKETVRRRVCELVDADWLARRNSRLYLTAKGYQALAPVREQIERLAACNYDVVARLVAETRP